MPLLDATPDALSRIYATTLFNMGKEQGGPTRVEELLGELEDILELARGNAKFAEFLSSLILPARKREASLKAILQGRVSDLMLRFMLVLNQKDRLAHLPSITTSLEQLVQQSVGRVEVDVYTAHPIDQQQMNDIRERLQTVLKREPVLHAYTQPAMIGGLKLQIGDQLIDASVQTSLRRMREKLNGPAGATIRAEADRLIG